MDIVPDLRERSGWQCWNSGPCSSELARSSGIRAEHAQVAGCTCRGRYDQHLGRVLSPRMWMPRYSQETQGRLLRPEPDIAAQGSQSEHHSPVSTKTLLSSTFYIFCKVVFLTELAHVILSSFWCLWPGVNKMWKISNLLTQRITRGRGKVISPYNS